MSAATKAALDDALAAHIADEKPNHYVAGYVLQVVGSTLEDRTSWYVQYTPEHQPFHVTSGLVAVADLQVVDTWNED